jgi:predicted kinase
MDLIIFVGIQGSGKSTFYKKRFINTHVRLNLDMLKTRQREKRLFSACLEAKQSVVIYNTNPTIEDRARYIPYAKLAGFRISGYFFVPDLADCLRRNDLRGEKKIPTSGVAATLQKLEPPTYEEGFDVLYTVRIVRRKFEVITVEKTSTL